MIQASTMEAEAAVRAIYEFAAERMKAGLSHERIESELIERGLDSSAAAIVVRNLAEARRQSGRNNMVAGALWCVGGTLVTVLTYQAAGPGGTYVVAWGAIIFGAIQFFHGAAAAISPARTQETLPHEPVSTLGPAEGGTGPPQVAPHPDHTPDEATEPRVADSVRGYVPETTRRLGALWKLVIALIVIYVALRVVRVVMQEGM